MNPFLKPLSILLYFLFLFSCGSNKDELIPDFVISKKKMINLTVDIKLIESTVSLQHYDYETEVSKIDSLYQSVYSKYNITKHDFDTSMVFYASRPKLLEEIFDASLTELSKLEASIAK